MWCNIFEHGIRLYDTLLYIIITILLLYVRHTDLYIYVPKWLNDCWVRVCFIKLIFEIIEISTEPSLCNGRRRNYCYGDVHDNGTTRYRSITVPDRSYELCIIIIFVFITTSTCPDERRSLYTGCPTNMYTHFIFIKYYVQN